MDSKYRKKQRKGLMLSFSVLFFFCAVLSAFLYQVSLRMHITTQNDGQIAYWEKIILQPITMDLFLFVTWDKMKKWLIFMCLSFTGFWQICLFWLIIKNGCIFGYLFGFCMNRFGAKGILLLCGYYFPQCLIEIPMWLYLFQKFFLLHREEKKEKQTQIEEKYLHNKFMLNFGVKGTMILLFLCVLNGLLESVFGTIILKKVLNIVLRS